MPQEMRLFGRTDESPSASCRQVTGTTEESGRAQTSTRVHVNRAFGGNRHNCAVDVHIDAGIAAGEETGTYGRMFVAAETVGPVVFNVHRGIRRLFHE